MTPPRASPCPLRVRRARWDAVLVASSPHAVEWLVVRAPHRGAPVIAAAPRAAAFAATRGAAWRARVAAAGAAALAVAAAAVRAGALGARAAAALLVCAAAAACAAGQRTAAEGVTAARGGALSRVRVRADGALVAVGAPLPAAAVRAVLLHEGFANCGVRWFLLAELVAGAAASVGVASGGDAGAAGDADDAVLLLDRARPSLGALARILRTLAPLFEREPDAGRDGAGGRAVGGAAAPA
jgi:hypothetical protein